MTATQLDSIDSERTGEYGLLSHYETSGSGLLMTDSGEQGLGELSNTGVQSGDTQFLLCKFFRSLIETEEHLMKAKADFLEMRFDLERRLLKKFSPIMLF